jgi:hypothetical protein
MDIQHAPLLIRERAHSAARPTASSAARSYCALAALLVLVAGMAAPCVPALAAEPLAVLREDNPSDPKQGKRYVGSTTWRTESIPPAAGRPAEVALRADVEIPERQIGMKWSLRRNRLPPNAPGGGVAQAPGVVMKSKEDAQGMPLSGAAATVTNGFFIFALAAISAPQNLQLLKEREWFDVPFAYANGTRAVISFEKGEPGGRAFAEAFAAWSK